jgi:serine/threonine protein kinase
MTRTLPKAALFPFLLAAASVPAQAREHAAQQLVAPAEGALESAASTALAPAPQTLAAPRFLGPYRVLRELGAGGMGRVFLAESEAPVRRRVALKVIREGLFSPRLFKQFDVERQALASLEHDHIARLYDTGADSEGRPWMAMEWIEGEPITSYCEARELDLDERLRLFAQVARAVEHMHARGVLHGDLKPDNILVTERDGHATPKVIDLGLARVSGAGASEHGDDTEFVMGTPAYMAPEHFAFGGPRLDERSDVFALGVVLRELLVGDAETETGEAKPMWHGALAPRPAPSAALLADGALGENAARRRGMGRAKLLARLRAGLDAVVRRATALDPEHRTRSASALAREVDLAVSKHARTQILRRAAVSLGAAASLGAALGALVTHLV